MSRNGAKGVAAGEITEVFACGTAAVITPVSVVKYGMASSPSPTVSPVRS